MTPQERQYHAGQLVRLADLMETCDYGDAMWKQLQRDYKAHARLLFPDKFKTKRKSFASTLEKCSCGSTQLKLITQGKNATILCEKCDKTTGICTSKNKARDMWNELQKATV